MNQQSFLQMDDGLEHQEQLFLLEVLVDKIKIEQSKVPGYLLEPYGPLIVKAKFLDFPDLEFDQGKCAINEEVAEPTSAKRLIAEAPEGWSIELAKDLADYERYPQYRVTIPIQRADAEEDVVQTLVPQSAIVTGEGLRYINAVLKTDLDPSTMALVHQQIDDEVNRIGGLQTGDTTTEYTFAAGKSLMFSMTPYKVIKGLKKSPLYIQVTRSGMYANDKPFFTLLGQVKFLLGDAFVKVVMIAGNTKILPVSAHIEDQYPISNVFGEKTGTISIFLRLSCFGKSMFEPEKSDLPSKPLCPTQDQHSLKKKFHPLYSDECDQPLTIGKASADAKYGSPVPWRKPWDDLPEFPKPLPVLPPFYEPLPPLPSPPPPTKPFDIGEHLPELPRCSPRQPPPCYRRAGDPPLSYCVKSMEAQLKLEEMTQYTQTDSVLKLDTSQVTTRSDQSEHKKEMAIKNDSSKKYNCPNLECDSTYSRQQKREDLYYNRFDGNAPKPGTSKEDTSTNIKKGSPSNQPSEKKCTCPKLPEILLPQHVRKSQCACKCGEIRAEISQNKKIAELYQETMQDEHQEGSERKDSSEVLPSGDEPTFPRSEEKKKKISTVKFPKNNKVFFLPGIDESTNIILTHQKCGYDLSRYLQRAKEKGKFEDVVRYIDPNPLAGFKPSKLSDEVKMAIEKEIKNMEEKKPRYIKNIEKLPASKSKIDEKLKEVDKQKSDLRKDGAQTVDEKDFDISKTTLNKKEQREKAKIKASNIYEYTAGMYPGIHVGHKYCVRPLRLVPKTMGWLWNMSDLGGALKPGRGWRPGAVRRNVNNLLKEWRKNTKGGRDMNQDLDMDMMMPSKPKRFRPITPKSQGSKKDLDTLKLNPTIHLHKKDRFYYVSMYPVKTESQEELGEEPQPIQFKIDRNHPDGSPESGESCFLSTGTSSDSSSYEVEYIAPAAMKPKKPKVEKTHMFSQYNEEDFIPKKIFKKGTKPEEQQQEAPKKTVEKAKKKKNKGKKGKGAKKGGKKKK